LVGKNRQKSLIFTKGVFLNNLINLMCKGSRVNLIVFLMLLWGFGMAFALPPIAAAGFFCAVVVPVALVSLGKKYAVPFAGLGFAWFVIAVIMHFR